MPQQSQLVHQHPQFQPLVQAYTKYRSARSRYIMTGNGRDRDDATLYNSSYRSLIVTICTDHDVSENLLWQCLQACYHSSNE